MQLEWMGEYRDVVEKLIQYCNVYARVYKTEKEHGTKIAFFGSTPILVDDC